MDPCGVPLVGCRPSRLSPFAVLALVLTLASSAAVQAAPPDKINVKLEAMLARIQMAPADRRVKTAEDLEMVVGQLGPAELKSIKAQTLDDIADLLNSPLDGVKAAAAETLGRIGPQAARVLPLLRLTRDQLVTANKGGKQPQPKSFAAIQAAISKIGPT